MMDPLLCWGLSFPRAMKLRLYKAAAKDPTLETPSTRVKLTNADVLNRAYAILTRDLNHSWEIRSRFLLRNTNRHVLTNQNRTARRTLNSDCWEACRGTGAHLYSRDFSFVLQMIYFDRRLSADQWRSWRRVCLFGGLVWFRFHFRTCVLAARRETKQVKEAGTRRSCLASAPRFPCTQRKCSRTQTWAHRYSTPFPLYPKTHTHPSPIPPFLSGPHLVVFRPGVLLRNSIFPLGFSYSWASQPRASLTRITNTIHTTLNATQLSLFFVKPSTPRSAEQTLCSVRARRFLLKLRGKLCLLGG